MRILIDGSNLFGAGARAGVGLSLLPEIHRCMEDATFLTLVPDLPAYHDLSYGKNTSVMYFRRTTRLKNDLRRASALFFVVPYLARRFRADVCISLGDISPIGMPCPHITFLQQALFVYGEHEIGVRGWSPLRRLLLRGFLAHTVSHSAKIIVQTPIMASRLVSMFPGIEDKIEVISSPAPETGETPLGPANDLYPDILKCKKPIKLLFLAAPYPHKNHAILPGVAKELRRRNLSNQVQIFVTVDDSIFNSVRLRRKLAADADVITNLGFLNGDAVLHALRSSSALFIPTLVESYGNIYLEAMKAGLPILTSNRDFSHWMCRDFANYFDPLDPVSIVDAIVRYRAHPLDRSRYLRDVHARIAEFPRSWHEVALRFTDMLVSADSKSKHRHGA